MNGGSVCRKHGGGAPQVRAKAAERIAAAADPAAAKVIELMQNPDVPFALQLSAARDLLDRAGLKGPDTLLLTSKAKWEEAMDEVVFDIPDGAATATPEPDARERWIDEEGMYE